MTLLTKQEIEALLNGGIVGQCDLRDHAGDLARTALDALAQLADAEAAQALVVERAAQLAEDGLLSVDGGLAAQELRALADTDGLALVQSLRAERDAAIIDRDAHSAANRMTTEWLAQTEAEAANLRARLAAAEAERDQARADAQAAVAEALREAAEACQYLHVAKAKNRHFPWNNAVLQCCELLLALAPADGLAAVQALRAEATSREMEWATIRDEIVAERDDALARLAAAEGRVAALTEALEKIATSDIQSFMLDANFGLIKLSDNRRYCDEPDVKRLITVAKAALATVTPPADTGEGA